MNEILKKLVGDFTSKKEWRALEARAETLPGEYKVAYSEIKHYLWETAGPLTLAPFEKLVNLFEENAAKNVQVLEVTGRDAAAFADDLVRGEKTYAQDRRDKLNRNITKKLGK